MNMSLEDRLRAHYADRTAREELPGPDTEDALADTLGRAEDRALRPLTHHRWRDGHRPQLWLAVAAMLAVVAATAAVVAIGDDNSSDTSTEGDGQEPSTSVTTEPSTTTPSSTTAPPQSTTTTVTPVTSGRTVVVGVDGVLGGWDGSGWVDADAIGAVAGDEYQLVRVGDPVTTATATATTRICGAIDVETLDVGLGYPDEPLASIPVAVTGVADPMPRPVEVLDPSNPDYQDAAVRVMLDLGIGEPSPEIRQAVRADLDGDGTDEVLIAADHFGSGDDLLGEENEFSILFVRQVVGGSVRSTLVAQHFVTAESVPYLERYRVAAIADLNGDGLMEVAVDSTYYEGHSTIVYDLGPNRNPSEVLRAGCGV
jgi:hypothetical protein